MFDVKYNTNSRVLLNLTLNIEKYNLQPNFSIDIKNKIKKHKSMGKNIGTLANFVLHFLVILL